MKLKTILKISTPIAMVGVMTPIITSCGGNSFSFEYKEDINCLAKETGEDAIPYHSIKSVAGAVKKCADRETRPTVNLTEVNNGLWGEGGKYENLYFDIIASYSILTSTKFKITNWNDDSVASKQITFTITLENEQTISGLINTNAYDDDGTQIFIKLNAEISIKSYTYKDCTPA